MACSRCRCASILLTPTFSWPTRSGQDACERHHHPAAVSDDNRAGSGSHKVAVCKDSKLRRVAIVQSHVAAKSIGKGIPHWPRLAPRIKPRVPSLQYPSGPIKLQQPDLDFVALLPQLVRRCEGVLHRVGHTAVGCAHSSIAVDLPTASDWNDVVLNTGHWGPWVDAGKRQSGQRV